MNGVNKLLRLFSFITLIFLSQLLLSQEKFRVVFYNVENLYDTKDNPETNDDDLTPDGQLHWTNYRYWQKLNNISEAISSVGNGFPPALVGLAEVENDSVLFDLTRRASLRKHKYEYIITESKDFRGSNTALLYQRDQIRILSRVSYTPHIDSVKTTRDILHVTGRVVNGDILDVFVCHFPSRNEGIKRTRPYRIKCADLLRQKVDSLFRVRQKANIIIMGDFNDYPGDISLKDTLRAQQLQSVISDSELYNLFFDKSLMKNRPIGSYKYRGKWNYIDQLIVSGNLLDSQSGTYIINKEACVHSADFLLHKDSEKHGGLKPFRTYSGWKYLGGYSDHLPVYLDLQIIE